jgi:methylmalonyl-CoA mutase N-terminal domain/subunit
LLKIDEEVAKHQIENLHNMKHERNSELLKESLKRLKNSARGTENLMPYIIDAVKNYASIGEIINTLKEVFGTYQEDSIF